MRSLPDGVAEYKRTDVFDAETVPAGLRRSHTTRSGVWAEVVVLEGTVRYVTEGDEPGSFLLTPGVPGVIVPEAPHHVEPEPGSRFYVRFLR